MNKFFYIPPMLFSFIRCAAMEERPQSPATHAFNRGMRLYEVVDSFRKNLQIVQDDSYYNGFPKLLDAIEDFERVVVECDLKINNLKKSTKEYSEARNKKVEAQQKIRECVEQAMPEYWGLKELPAGIHREYPESLKRYIEEVKASQLPKLRLHELEEPQSPQSRPHSPHTPNSAESRNRAPSPASAEREKNSDDEKGRSRSSSILQKLFKRNDSGRSLGQMMTSKNMSRASTEGSDQSS